MEAKALLGLAVRLGASYADLRLQTIVDASAEVQDSDTRVQRTREAGAGLRVLVDGAWGFASASGKPRTRLAELAVRSAKAAAGRGETRRALALRGRSFRAIPSPRKPPGNEDLGAWIASLKELEREARRTEEVSSVTLAFRGQETTTRIVASDGTDARLAQVRVLLQSDVVARRGSRRGSYRGRLGATAGAEFLSPGKCREAVRDARDRAVRQLDARAPPAGRMAVVADPELTGVFCHEAIGHASEADLVLAGESQLDGMLGKRLAPEAVSIVDDPRIPRAYGSVVVDDEGVPALRKPLIQKGVLAGFIHSRETAATLGMSANGGARAESYACEPLVRMTNTVMLPGSWGLEEMLEGIRRGVLACGSRGGQVDTAKGPFQFTAQEAFLIEKGELTRPLRDTAISGTMLRTLGSIDAVGREARLGSPGLCGKGQWVPVCDGGPHIRIRQAVVGGA